MTLRLAKMRMGKSFSTRQIDNGKLGSFKKFLALSLGLKLLLDIGYIMFVAPVFGYAGFALHMSFARIATSYLLTFALTFLVARIARRTAASSLGLIFLFAAYMLPILSYWALSGAPVAAMAVFTTGFVVSALVISVKLPRLSVPRINPVLAMVGMGVFGCVTLGLVMARGGGEIFNLSFQNTYDFRAEVYSHVITGFMGYLVPWYGKCVAVILMALTLAWRRWGLFAGLVLAQLILFGLTNNKEYLTYPLLVLLLFGAGTRAGVGNRLLSAFLATVAIGCASFLLFHSIAIPGTFIMRTFFAQALNSFQYYSFFLTHDFVAWSNSFLSVFIGYPYSAPIPEIIGAGRYGADSAAFANTGYLGSGYMQLGIAGVLFNSIGAGVLLRLFDLLTSPNIPLIVPGSIVCVICGQLINADLPIVFLSSGAWLAALLLVVLGTQSSNRMPLARSTNLAGGRP